MKTRSFVVDYSSGPSRPKFLEIEDEAVELCRHPQLNGEITVEIGRMSLMPVPAGSIIDPDGFRFRPDFCRPFDQVAAESFVNHVREGKIDGLSVTMKAKLYCIGTVYTSNSFKISPVITGYGNGENQIKFARLDKPVGKEAFVLFLFP